ncbi:hypothetical protein ALC56_07218 [Trachymyrmex septentrionalis]|uniref:Uncharacterized protein n=1 Tax=Trachymyrmex septentrionalis TaxID=34720 RepID=A0A195FCP5_9HYME|nr:hypothetical protein ALC56_07218 [Trachymyrmex septentrionalis]
MHFLAASFARIRAICFVCLFAFLSGLTFDDSGKNPSVRMTFWDFYSALDVCYGIGISHGDDML